MNELTSCIEVVFHPPNGFRVVKSKNLSPSPADVIKYLLQLEVSILFKKSVWPIFLNLYL